MVSNPKYGVTPLPGGAPPAQLHNSAPGEESRGGGGPSPDPEVPASGAHEHQETLCGHDKGELHAAAAGRHEGARPLCLRFVSDI